MIALILGTTEGKRIVSLLNEFTDDLLISTATSYGGELLKDFRYKLLNTKPLDIEEMRQLFSENKATHLVDASHPYAVVVTQNAKKVCETLNIEYIRYERPSVIGKYSSYQKLIEVDSYEKLGQKVKEIPELEGESAVLLNTCGSKEIVKMLSIGLNNRIIHRVLPSIEVMEKCLSLGVKVEDIIAIKGPVGYELNLGFIKEYDAKAIIMKDSGTQGGTEEKLAAAIDRNIYIFVIGRNVTECNNSFNNEEAVVEYLRGKLL